MGQDIKGPIWQKYGLGAAMQHPARGIELEWPETIDAADGRHVEWPDYEGEWRDYAGLSPLITSNGQKPVQHDRGAGRMEK